MASPHVKAYSKVGFDSKTRTVFNLPDDISQILVFDDTGQFPITGMQPPVFGGIWSRLPFSTELNPSGSSAGAKTPPDGILFKACGLDEAVSTTVSTTYTWTGDPSDATAVDLSVLYGGGTGMLMTCSNAFGSVALKGVAGRPVICDWGFDGIMTAPAEGTLTDTLTNGGLAPALINTTSTINSDDLVLKEWNLVIPNATNSPNLDMSAAGGVADPSLVPGAVTFDALVETPAQATANFYTDLSSRTLVAISIAFGSGAGYVITIALKGYVNIGPANIFVGGVMCSRLSYRMDTASGSPLTIAFT